MSDSAVITTPFDAGSTAADVIADVDLTGKRAVVTGGASGIGVETARALAVAGTQVTLAVRDTAAGNRVADDIGHGVMVAALDLADPVSIGGFVRAWDQPLDILVNNAGVMAIQERRLSISGHEMQFATNHLGHFALTTGLHRWLAAAAGARVVSVSSSGHLRSPVVFDDLDFRFRDYEPFSAYGQSKTANVLFAVELSRRWAADGITSNAELHAAVATVGGGRQGRRGTARKGIPIRNAAYDVTALGYRSNMNGLSLDYAGLMSASLHPPLDPALVGAALVTALAGWYETEHGLCALYQFDQSGASYLFDLASSTDLPQEDRTIAAWALTPRVVDRRDIAYQRGFPMDSGADDAPVDRGHLIPHLSGGEFGPNIFRQDRALNRGWSEQGKRYRALEREAAATPGTLYFGHLIYTDDTAYPSEIEIGILRGATLQVERFDNRPANR